jgi:hypothetical protein
MSVRSRIVGTVFAPFLSKGVVVLPCLLTGFLLWQSTALAQIAAAPCNPAILQQMDAKAVQNTMQEAVQNQSFVIRPDSVLEYSCFERTVPPVGIVHAPVFSENTYWGMIHDALHTDRILEQVVMVPLRAYLPSQFPNTYLAVRSTRRGCDQMARVWHEAKCRNFQTVSGEGYFSFDQYPLIADPRINPTASCAKPNWGVYNAAARTGTWEAGFKSELQTTFTNVTNTLRPGACGAPVYLQVQVKLENTTPYPDAFCLKPGCIYNPDSHTCQ